MISKTKSTAAKTTEYQHFPAECYLKPKEENALGAEQSNLGKEITTLQPTQKSAKGAKTNGLIDKIFNSIKSCGVAASVAVVAVAGATTVAPAPKAQFVHLAVESTQIEYVLSVEELNLQNQYAVVLSASGEDVATIPIEEDGLHENSIERNAWTKSFAERNFPNQTQRHAGATTRTHACVCRGQR